MTKKEASELAKIFAEKKEKEKEVKKEIKVTSQSESGINDIKKTLDIKELNTEIRYLGSSRFSIEVKAKNYKAANHKLETILKQIEAKAKQLKLKLEVKEK